MAAEINAVTQASRLRTAAISIPAAVADPIDLSKRPRYHELFIKVLLLLCGAISILTTIGIVLVLGNESLNLFTRQQWELTNKTLTAPITAETTTLTVSNAGSTLEIGETIRISDEVMQIVGFEENKLTVERGAQETIAATHDMGTDIFLEERVELLEFFTGDEWSPQIGKFGVRPLVNATLMTSMIAMFVALPLGMGAAIYLSEYAPRGLRNTLKPILEILAGIPTVVYGYFALTFMTPLLRAIFGIETVQIYNTAAAGIVVGILIIPLVSSMSEDALSAVPRSLREASYSLGATKLETSIRVVIPAALSGILAAFIVAISRAIGETMIVAIAAGAGPNFTFNAFDSAETMTGHIARISGGDLSYDSIDYNSIFAIGLALFVITLVLNFISRSIISRFREAY
jgi:phosphate transport system permease protein